jgi:hypothetical protein
MSLLTKPPLPILPLPPEAPPWYRAAIWPNELLDWQHGVAVASVLGGGVSGQVLVNQNPGSPVWGSAGGSAFHFITPPVAGWSWFNQGTASVLTNADGSIYIHAIGAALTNVKGRTRSMGSKTTLSAAFCPNLMGTSATINQPFSGIMVLESGTGKFYICGVQVAGGGAAVNHYSNATTFVATDKGFFPYNTSPVYFQFQLSGANMLFNVSTDGVNYLNILTVAKTAYFAVGPDTWGFMVMTGSAAFDCGVTLQSWLEQ